MLLVRAFLRILFLQAYLTFYSMMYVVSQTGANAVQNEPPTSS